MTPLEKSFMFLFPALILVSSAPAAPVSWSCRAWQSDDGLPNNEVTGLAQTPDGYLWLATPGRIARFDGDQFEDFSQNNFIPRYSQRVTVIINDHDGGLWLPMDHGPVIHLKNGVFETITNDLPSLMVEDAAEDGEGALWISYRGGTLRRIKDGKTYRFAAADGLPALSGGISLAVDQQGQIWFAQKARIFCYRHGQFTQVLQLPNFTTRIVGSRDGGLWLCSGTDFFKYDQSHGLRHIGALDAGLTHTEPVVLLAGRDGSVWIGTSSSGLYHYDGSHIEAVHTPYPGILCLFEDREGNIWVGTDGGGLYRIQRQKIQLQGTDSGLPFENIQSLCEDTNGVIWAVTLNNILVSHQNGFWSVPTNWPGGMVGCVAADPNGGIWVGGRSRLYYWHDPTFLTFTNGLANHIIRALFPTTNSDVWIGGETLEKFHDGVFTHFRNLPEIEIVRAIARDNAGNLWAGTANGLLLCITNGQVADKTMPVFGAFDSIRCLATTPDGAVWIGFANDGIGRYQRGKFSRIRASQGLGDDSISQIVPDGAGWLWIGADHGLFKVRQRELDAIAEGMISRVQTIHYGRDEGLASLQANFGASPGALSTRDGRLWMPFRSALAVIDPTQLSENLDPPPVLLKRVAVDDQTLGIYAGPTLLTNQFYLQKSQDVMRLPPGRHRLEFDFTALYLTAPENVQFRYRLAGVDDDWIEGKNQRNVSYPGLAAGHYKFEVTARKNGGPWNPNIAAFVFSIRPYFWDTWWFHCLALAVFTASVVALGRYAFLRRLQSKVRLLEQQAALEKERARIAKDIHDDLGGSLTHAALLLNLALQDNHAPDKAASHVKQAAAAVREVTESLDEIVWAANPRNDTLADLNDYLSLFATQFLQAAGIRCRIDSPSPFPHRALSPEVRHSLFLVAKETLNNAVRHAHATEVRLQILVTDRALNLNISDDGCGFNGQPSNHGGSDGLRNMRQRMTDLGGQFSVQSQPGIGTSISAVYFWPQQE